MTKNEEEHRKILQEYYRVYRELQKRHNLREHSHFDIYGNNYIEIWEYRGESRIRIVCKVKEESDAACYKRATEELKIYARREEQKEYEKAG